MMTVLASARAKRKTIALGRFRLAEGPNRDAPAGYGNAIIAADGRVIFFAGTTIRYAGGREFTARGLPHGWQISALAASPRDSSVFLAIVQTNPNVPGGCRSNDEKAGLYLITPSGSTKLKGYDPCAGTIDVQWSPNGRRILWFLGADEQHLFISDGQGHNLHELIGQKVFGALWSPDGREIALGYSRTRVDVLDLASGASHFVGTGQLRAWSPDGKELALIRERPIVGSGFPGGSIVAVPVRGGPARLLIKLPPKKF
jgi:Tol biopolymer transport system component